MKRTVGATRLAASAVLLAACQGDLGSDPPETLEEGFETVPEWTPGSEATTCNLDALLTEASYGRKVKSLLTGLPLTEAELSALREDPAALRGLIDGWLALPEAQVTLMSFFSTAFQQTSTNNDSFFYLMGRNVQATGRFTGPQSATISELLNENLRESFARTMLVNTNEGASFKEALLTDTFMMTTAQMAFMAYTDDEVVDDAGVHQVRTTTNDFDDLVFYKTAADAPPLAQALDPQHAKFGHFFHNGLAGLDAACGAGATVPVDTTATQAGKFRIAGNATSPSYFIFSMMMGRHQPLTKQGSTGCGTGGSAQGKPFFQREDFTDWRLVKVRKPAGGERPTTFYELASMRDATELVVHTDRLGFLTSPGFFSTWMNNEDNAARVSVNQALIVALGKSFEGQAVTDFAPTNLDAEHADPTTECYGCHQTLDPMRDFFRSSYTSFYSQQLDPVMVSAESDFVFGGVTTKGSGIRDFAEILANHPDFPYAWAHKLCYTANGAACADGPMLDAVVTAFEESGFDFRVLVRELFASPLVTGSTCDAGAESGAGASIARRTLFCTELSHRLGIEDVCGLHSFRQDGTALQNDARDASSAIPDDGFSRAVVEPVVITETSLFTRANAEATCTVVAPSAYDTLYVTMPSSDEATLHMVTTVMGLPPSDERHGPALDVLRAHVAEAIEAGQEERAALESAFILSCMAPSIAGVGF